MEQGEAATKVDECLRCREGAHAIIYINKLYESEQLNVAFVITLFLTHILNTDNLLPF